MVVKMTFQHVRSYELMIFFSFPDFASLECSNFYGS